MLWNLPCDFHFNIMSRSSAVLVNPNHNLTVNFVDQSTVILSWNPPSFLGGRSDTVFRVECDACGPSVIYSPNSEIFNDTKITISGLSPVTTYRFQVFSANGVSDMTNEAGDFVDITVTTEASVMSASVNNVRVTSVKAAEITLTWDPPFTPEADMDSPDHVEIYEVRYFSRHDEINATSKMTKVNQIVINSLRQRTEYGFQVRAKTTHGWGDFSQTVFKTTGQVLGTAYIGDEDNMQVRIIAGATVAVVVLLVIIIIMTVLFLRSRTNDECNKKQPSDCDTLEYRNGEVRPRLLHVCMSQLRLRRFSYCGCVRNKECH
ncbi:hypothetical protein J6590_008451 [Homalodisca vitripennis]|nr:hypothetical protein J6590_008451 [Homalodisca vitripennis]